MTPTPEQSAVDATEPAPYVRGQAAYFDDGGEMLQPRKVARTHLAIALTAQCSPVDDEARAHVAATFFGWLPIAACTMIGRPAFLLPGATAPGVTAKGDKAGV